jgi:hypothetical protein
MEHNEKNIKTNEQKNAAWFLNQGYLSPEEMIDYDDNLDHIESFIQIFAAYNQHNTASGAAWDTWPDWELCLTSMDSDLHFVDPGRDPPETVAQREHWLAVTQLIHEHEAVSYEGYTITIQGKHGHTFAFDFCLEIEAWGAPGTYAEYKARLEANAKKPKAWMWRREGYAFEDVVVLSRLYPRLRREENHPHPRQQFLCLGQGRYISFSTPFSHSSLH